MAIHSLTLWFDFKYNNITGEENMKTVIIALLMALSIQAFAKEGQPNKEIEHKYSKVATVHGMVCAFCSNSLEKKFKKEKAVENISVDLESKIVSIKFNKGKSLPDKKLKKMITSSGFKVVSIKNYEPKAEGNTLGKK